MNNINGGVRMSKTHKNGGGREICSGPECIGHEDGGRESGNGVPERATESPKGRIPGRTHPGAANPAACPICGATRDTEGHDFTERIRALETELLGQRPALEMAISREGFEKRRAEKAESDGRLLGKMLDAQNEKLQKAKVRVKELEAACREAKRAMDGWLGEGNSPRGQYDTKAQAVVNKALADLRGEGSG